MSLAWYSWAIPLLTNNTPAPKLRPKRAYDESRRSSSSFDNVSSTEGCACGQHRYQLAYQIETSGTHVTLGSAWLDDNLYSDIDYRRRSNLSSEQPHPGTPSLGLSRSSPFLHAKTARILTTAGRWTASAPQVIGNVLGKVRQFCTAGASAFQRFKAVGGKAGQLINHPPPLTKLPPIPLEPGNPPEDPLSPPGAFSMVSDVSYYRSY